MKTILVLSRKIENDYLVQETMEVYGVWFTPWYRIVPTQEIIVGVDTIRVAPTFVGVEHGTF